MSRDLTSDTGFVVTLLRRNHVDDAASNRYVRLATKGAMNQSNSISRGFLARYMRRTKSNAQGSDQRFKKQFSKPRIGNDETIYLLPYDLVDHLGGIIARVDFARRKARSGSKVCIKAKFQQEEIQQPKI
jgi:hypothetical protein